MSFSEFEIKRLEKIVGQYIEKRRPPVHVRNEVDLAYKIEGQSVIILEIRALWNNPEEKIESPIAKATYVKRWNQWNVYWHRSDMKWHGYDPDSEVDRIEDFLKVIEEDKYGCFFG